MIYCKNWRLKHLEQASRGFKGGKLEGYSLRRQVSTEKNRGWWEGSQLARLLCNKDR
jgi:hypothetical protein